MPSLSLFLLFFKLKLVGNVVTYKYVLSFSQGFSKEILENVVLKNPGICKKCRIKKFEIIVSWPFACETKQRLQWVC